jgi:hypothetical protein
MEQQSLYSNINFSLPARGQPVVSTVIPTLLCPSDSGANKVFQAHNIAPTSYSASQGFHWWTDAILGPWAPWDTLGFTEKPAADMAGLFAPTLVNKIRDITDGTSNTMVIGETDTFGFYGGPGWTCGTGKRREIVGAAVFRAAFLGAAHAGSQEEVLLTHPAKVSLRRSPSSFDVQKSASASDSWIRKSAFVDWVVVQYTLLIDQPARVIVGLARRFAPYGSEAFCSLNQMGGMSRGREIPDILRTPRTQTY